MDLGTLERRVDAAPATGVPLHVGLAWRRVQLLLTLEPATSILPRGSLGLVSEDGSWMPATGGHLDGRALVVRFNVMQGPGQVPLAAGPWRLATRIDGEPPEPLRVATLEPPEAAERSYTIGRREYRVRPSIDATGYVWIDVELEAVPEGVAQPAEAEDGPDRPEDSDTEAAALAAPSAPPTLPARLVKQARRRARRTGGRLRGGTFRLLLDACAGPPRRGRPAVLFTSDSRATLGGNLAMVHQRMVERGLDHQYDLWTLLRPSLQTSRSWHDRLRMPWVFGRADVILVDDYQPLVYGLPPDTAPIVQLWHAFGAFKTVGYSRVGKPGAPNPFGRAHKNYSYATVSGRGDVEVYAEAFGIPESRVVATGVPRLDRMFDPEHRARALEAVHAAHPELRGRQVWLVAPTFRGRGARSATYDTSRLELERLHALCVEKDAVCIVRLHPFVGTPLEIPPELRDRIIDGSHADVDINDLLFAVDLLITDYSSIVYEYSTLGRPALFYAWDLDEYVRSRDFYEPYESFVPGRIVRTFDELEDAIRREDFEVEKMAEFAERHFEHLDAGSTDRVIDLILEAAHAYRAARPSWWERGARVGEATPSRIATMRD